MNRICVIHPGEIQPALKHARRSLVAGFSLIEVLISITVLSLALLGLAAVFPAVLKQQQRASDTAQGESVARSAADALTGTEFMSTPTDRFKFAPFLVSGGVPAYDKAAARGWTSVLVDNTWSVGTGSEIRTPDKDKEWTGPWETPKVTASGGTAVLSVDPATGDMVIGTATGETDPSKAGFLRVRAADRLSPRPFTTGAEPRFVWDIAARRVYSGTRVAGVLAPDPMRDAIDVAVFVRRVDSSIRLTGDATLAQVFGDPASVPSTARRVPVAVDAAGRPTNDGRGKDSPNYSPIWLVEFKRVVSGEFDRPPSTAIRADMPYEPDMIDISAPHFRGESATTITDETLAAQYAAQIGQKFVGMSGSVYRVIELVQDPDDPKIIKGLRLDRPLRSQDLSLDGAAMSPPAKPPVQLLMTPQVPAAVRLFRAHPKFGDPHMPGAAIRS